MIRQLTACRALKEPMDIEMSTISSTHRMGEHATHPIAGLPSRLALLLLQQGMALPRRRLSPIGSAKLHSGTFNCRI